MFTSGVAASAHIKKWLKMLKCLVKKLGCFHSVQTEGKKISLILQNDSN